MVLDAQILEAKPAILLWSADIFPRNKAFGSTGLVAARPHERSAFSVQGSNYTLRQFQRPHGLDEQVAKN